MSAANLVTGDVVTLVSYKGEPKDIELTIVNVRDTYHQPLKTRDAKSRYLMTATDATGQTKSYYLDEAILRY